MSLEQTPRKDSSHGKCRLCPHEGELRNSHVISEFLFKDYYGPKGSYIQLSNFPNDHRSPVVQKAPRERLLCQSCEIKLSRWERYCEQVISRVKGRSCVNGLIYESDVQYEPFKLFLNSLLWRISISTLPEFSQCSIGKSAETVLKRSLQSEKPEYPSHFHFRLYKLKQVGEYDPKQSAVLPVSFRLGTKVKFHGVVLAGLQFSWYEIPEHERENLALSDSLSQKGGLSVYEGESTGLDEYRYRAAAVAITIPGKSRDKWIRDGGFIPPMRK